MYEQPSRQACDRCHGFKLRCHRNEAGECSRCLKAGATCVFSPSIRGRRPNHGNRRSGSQTFKSVGDERPKAKLAPQMLQGLRSDPRDCLEDEQRQPQFEKVKNIPVSGDETGGPTSSNMYMGVGHDINMSESFTSPFSLSGAPLEPDFFSRFSQNDGYPITPITDLALPFLGTLSAHNTPEVAPTENRNSPQILQPPSQQTRPSKELESTRKMSLQTQFIQQFMKDLLQLDMDLIRHTLEDPVVFDPAPMTPKSDGSKAPSSMSDCAFDITLALTQKLIKLFGYVEHWNITQSFSFQNSHFQTPLFMSTFPSRSQQSINIPSRQNTSVHLNTEGRPQEPTLDQISLLHALSTYMRLIEVYDITFTKTADKFGLALAEGSPIPLPPLQIGAFDPEDPADHVALVIQSALRLLRRLKEIVKKVTTPFLGIDGGSIDATRSPGPSSEHNSIKSLMVTVVERENQLMRAVTRLDSCCHK